MWTKQGNSYYKLLPIVLTAIYIQCEDIDLEPVDPSETTPDPLAISSNMSLSSKSDSIGSETPYPSEPDLSTTEKIPNENSTALEQRPTEPQNQSPNGIVSDLNTPEEGGEVTPEEVPGPDGLPITSGDSDLPLVTPLFDPSVNPTETDSDYEWWPILLVVIVFICCAILGVIWASLKYASLRKEIKEEEDKRIRAELLAVKIEQKSGALPPPPLPEPPKEEKPEEMVPKPSDEGKTAEQKKTEENSSETPTTVLYKNEDTAESRDTPRLQLKNTKID